MGVSAHALSNTLRTFRLREGKACISGLGWTGRCAAGYRMWIAEIQSGMRRRYSENMSVGDRSLTKRGSVVFLEPLVSPLDECTS